MKCSIKSAVQTVVLFGLSLMIIGSSTRQTIGDEGMWLFNDLPIKHLQEKHGFTPTAEWSEHIMKSCVRFNVGGSASFISSNGLVLTNHHVGSDTLFKLSNEENDYYNDGFLAKSFDKELKAPDLELNQLINIKDVTATVNSAVDKGLSGPPTPPKLAVLRLQTSRKKPLTNQGSDQTS